MGAIRGEEKHDGNQESPQEHQVPEEVKETRKDEAVVVFVGCSSDLAAFGGGDYSRCHAYQIQAADFTGEAARHRIGAFVALIEWHSELTIAQKEKTYGSQESQEGDQGPEEAEQT